MTRLSRRLAVLLCLAPAAWAADSMKPGLYEYDIRMEMPGMPFAMPPQKVKHCLTQEQVDRNEQFRSGDQQDCKVSNLKQAAGKVSFDVACKNGTGHAEYTYDAGGMKGKTTLNMDGQTAIMNMAAKRVGDCK